ncbi:MAG: hypothetical protein ACREIU_02635, partial [Planctomycetota bacterium]
VPGVLPSAGFPSIGLAAVEESGGRLKFREGNCHGHGKYGGRRLERDQETPPCKRKRGAQVACSQGLIPGPLLAIPTDGCHLACPQFQTGNRELAEQLRDTHEGLPHYNEASADYGLDAIRAAVEKARREAEDAVAPEPASETEARRTQRNLLDLKRLLSS